MLAWSSLSRAGLQDGRGTIPRARDADRGPKVSPVHSCPFFSRQAWFRVVLSLQIGTACCVLSMLELHSTQLTSKCTQACMHAH